ncbi:MAG: hypothetical protein ACOCRO_10475, partial [Halanaerobiales bacterium]
MSIRVWIVFACYSLFTGVFVATNKSLLISSLVTYLQTLVLMIYIVDVSFQEKSNKYFIKVYAIYSTLYMIIMLTMGIEGPGKRLYLSNSSNPNSDALTLVLGVFCLLLLVNHKKLRYLFSGLILPGMKIYTIVLT